MTEPAIDTGEILEALNDKVDRDCRNVDTTSGADVVVEYQLPTSSNDYKWYRLYKSGWLEQGGYTAVQSYAAGTNYTINLVKNFDSSNYFIKLQEYSNNTTISNENEIYVTQYNISNFTFRHTAYNGNTQTFGVNWEAKGMSAQS